MRKLFTFFILALATVTAMAQAPAGINYQAVARNASGQVLATQAVGVKISIIDGSPTGTVQYAETHTVTTNQFGLFNIVIGNGTLSAGTFAGITWASGNKYVKVEIDPTGGTAYVDMGTTKLQSVPYALFAPVPPPPPSDLSGNRNFIVKNNGSNLGINSDIWDSAGRVGIGNIRPMGALDVSGDIFTSVNKADTVNAHAPVNRDSSLIGQLSGTEFVGMELKVEPYQCGNGGIIRFKTWGCNTSVSREVMRINELGNVGIGTTNPSSILELSTNQTANVFKIHNPNLFNGSLVGMEFGKANTANNMAEFRYNHFADGSPLNYINLGLWNNTNTLIVQGSGNVGVGTTNPSTTLDVNGGIRTKFSGSNVITATVGAQTVNLSIPPLPAGWDYTNTVVLVSDADGISGPITQVKLTSLTNIAVVFNSASASAVRFNWIIFKM